MNFPMFTTLLRPKTIHVDNEDIREPRKKYKIKLYNTKKNYLKNNKPVKSFTWDSRALCGQIE